jgi:hypothetical protein
VRWWGGLSPLVGAALLMLLGSSCVAVQLSTIRIASATLIRSRSCCFAISSAFW